MRKRFTYMFLLILAILFRNCLIAMENENNIGRFDENGLTPLYNAVKNRDLEEVKSLLRSDIDVNRHEQMHMPQDNREDRSFFPQPSGSKYTNELHGQVFKGYASLHYAVQLRLTDIVGVLLHADADPNLSAPMKKNETPLSIFFSGDLEKMLQPFLSQDFDNVLSELIKKVRFRLKSSQFPFKVIKRLISDYDNNVKVLALVDELRQQCEKNNELIYFFAKEGCESVLNGVDINKQNRFGETPLHYAVNNMDGAAIRLFIENGANVKLKNHHGSTPLCLFTKRLIKEPSIQETNFHQNDIKNTEQENENENNQDSEFILENSNAREIQNRDSSDREQTFDQERRQSAPAKINHISSEDFQEKTKQTRKRRMSAPSQLVQQCIGRNKIARKNSNVIQAQYNSFEKNVGMDIDVSGSLQELFSAIDLGDQNQVRSLLDTQPKLVNMKKNNDDFATPLHAAVVIENIEFVRLLVTYGAKIDTVDSEGKTPLQLAEEFNCEDIVDFLNAHIHEELDIIGDKN